MEITSDDDGDNDELKLKPIPILDTESKSYNITKSMYKPELEISKSYNKQNGKPQFEPLSVSKSYEIVVQSVIANEDEDEDINDNNLELIPSTNLFQSQSFNISDGKKK